MLERCLQALARLEHPSFEVLVVDNTADDRAAPQLAAQFGARYLREAQVGLSRARNAGGRAARGDVVAFVDDDAVPDPAWLRSHDAALADLTLVGTTGRVLPAHPEAPGSRAYAAVGGEDVGEEAFTVDNRTAGWFERANFGGLGIGPNFALRRTLFDSGWSFREDLGLGTPLQGEEHYAFFDLIRLGHRIRYVPWAIVEHEAPATPDGVRARKRRIVRATSAYLVMLVVEEPGYRKAALRYALTGLSGRRRSWRPPTLEPSFVRRPELVRAALSGPAIYAWSRFTAARSRAAS
jgi:glycosyltransferase involved in cell wall biosynthesis